MLITSHYYRANDTNLFSFACMKSIEREREREASHQNVLFFISTD